MTNQGSFGFSSKTGSDDNGKSFRKCFIQE